MSSTEKSVLRQLGAAIRRERMAVDMTQDRLAELAKLHLRSLQKIEAGEINVLITTVQRIQRALDIPWGVLMK